MLKFTRDLNVNILCKIQALHLCKCESYYCFWSIIWYYINVVVNYSILCLVSILWCSFFGILRTFLNSQCIILNMMLFFFLLCNFSKMVFWFTWLCTFKYSKPAWNLLLPKFQVLQGFSEYWAYANVKYESPNRKWY